MTNLGRLLIGALALGCAPTAAPNESCKPLMGEIDRITKSHGRGSDQSAVPELKRIADRAAAEGCVEAEGLAWTGLGSLAIGRVDLQTALQHLARAEEVFARFPSDDPDPIRNRLVLKQNWGTAYLYLGWWTHAERVLEETLREWRKWNAPKGIGECHLQLARLERLRGQPDKARAHLLETERYSRYLEDVTKASIHQELVRLQPTSESPSSVLKAIDLALNRVDPDKDAYRTLLLDRAEALLADGRTAAARQQVAELKQTSTFKEQRFFAVHLNHVDSKIAAAEGRFLEAIDLIGKSLDLLEKSRRSWLTFGADALALRRESVWIRLDLARMEGAQEALKVFERYKSLGLLSSLWGEAMAEAGDFRQIGCSIPQNAWSADQTWGSESIAEYRSVARLTACIEKTRLGQVQQRSGPESHAQDPAERRPWDLNMTLPKMRSALGKDPVLILTPAADRWYILWWALGREPEGRLVDLKIDGMNRFLRLTSTPFVLPSQGIGADHKRLGELLFGPLLKELDASQHIWIVADGALDGYPVELLPRPDTGEPLLFSHAVSYLPSVASLISVRALSTSHEADEHSILMLGDPLFSSEDKRWISDQEDPRSEQDMHLAYRLPASGDEVRHLTDLYRDAGWTPTGWIGPKASRERFVQEARNHQIVHLATHAKADDEIPERSRVFLSCAGKSSAERCDLYLNEILDLRLNGSLVVLSACEGHAGLLRPGEGPLALSRAFLQAGASVVVASLRRVDDRETARLMGYFHEFLLQGRSVATSLQRAKLKAEEAGMPTDVWSAFVVYGDGALTLATLGLRKGEKTSDSSHPSPGNRVPPDARRMSSELIH